MNSQKSYQTDGPTLYIVPTPIGNLEDMTYRAVRTLREVDLIAAEDTRQTMKLCRHFEIDTKLVSYHEHNKQVSGPRLIEDIENGKSVAVVSDAGMPGISDPGSDLVRLAIQAKVPVVVLPGANAALTALVASGLPTERFLYYGFLPRKKKERVDVLASLQYEPGTLVFYEAPHRLKEMLQGVKAVLGNRDVVLGRELTKTFEEFLRGTVDEALAWCEGEVRGEFVVLVGGSTESAPTQDWWETLSPLEHVDRYIEDGLKPNAAIKQVAKERGLSRNDVYDAYHGVDKKE
ncbi:MAG: 16S rRNA (cytidine(1402)-2'-O)-methyltransferase [Exiguobacterium sp.]|uniref:16S rRNA (cytidine(1402)-2'-O)-methyltransferase n=1 Tax=Exiguobacterium TaxID=33986 RepID=UPI0004A94326|nr:MULTISPECIES: 16S rRNA (cytidine(1402)-2'-O)-methyltransferase [Exiguobacterium]MDX5322464.1 16S rRNA (cytidine(1402)-2'-O)-methyltransferase [Exiguobacterium sp.]KDN59648.1 16S rRNA methyltransferase [Exiguobacterium sp. AB2]MDX5424189.1 16S rRNA (cytidine(1402)-2'-O)-methyltransferase [Exiguobacterium sp.]MDX6771708.1 16S rRNA (cytidine(1402)-2'-O)-methyltransferase [Exiguobacterium sp.]QUE86710.1 16S rRNA (cytidine(1402)-2'-O)-methyltransferase [Exiguobacterium alkaliphilum]